MEGGSHGIIPGTIMLFARSD